MNTPPETPEQAAESRRIAALANGQRCDCPHCAVHATSNRAERRARRFAR